ncbi:hypothetical protein GOP47_0003267 [Adiantum capillus-veneris]|uniref:Uncharacterized protein n=1 Tax=Adiantum capillus-veneris TaxID=13818 RepID=A0A9D4VCG1_ADICA|nr:hypothetical protein GOP47_0003267 [Adiantum capillus-veneris]
MARKSMAASRKRTSPTRSEEGQQQQQQQQEQQQVEMEVRASQGQQGVPSPVDLPSSSAPSPSHTIGRKQNSHDDLQNMKKWLNARMKRKQVSMLESFSLLSEHVKELCKALNIVASFQKGNALTAGYDFDRTLLLCAGNFASTPEWASALTNIRTWMYGMYLALNAEQCSCDFINYAKLISEIKRSACDKTIFEDPSKFLASVCSQHEMMERLLSQVEENSNCCAKLSEGQELALSALVDASLHQSGPRGKRKKTWFEDLPPKAAKWLFPKNEGEQMQSMKSRKDDKSRIRSVSCKMSREKLAETVSWTAHQISHDDLESWIVKHSMPSMQRKNEELLKLVDNDGNTDYDFEERRKDGDAVLKTEIVGHSLPPKKGEHEVLMLSVNAEKAEDEDLKIWKKIKYSMPSMQRKNEEFLKLVDNDEKTGYDFEESRKDGNVVSETEIVGDSLPPKEVEHVEVLMSLVNGEKTEDEDLKNQMNSEIEIEVDLSGKNESLLEIDAAAAHTTFNIPYVKRIVKAVSISQVGLDGQSEAMVLFKALRSDETEVIVDNIYLRSMYPLLLVSFYEQNLHLLSEKRGTHHTKWVNDPSGSFDYLEEGPIIDPDSELVSDGNVPKTNYYGRIERFHTDSGKDATSTC